MVGIGLVVVIIVFINLGSAVLRAERAAKRQLDGGADDLKKIKGIGYQPPQDGGEDDEFRPIDPFGPSY